MGPCQARVGQTPSGTRQQHRAHDGSSARGQPGQGRGTNLQRHSPAQGAAGGQAPAATACPARRWGSHPGKANAPTLTHQDTAAGAAGTTRHRGRGQPVTAHMRTYAPIHSTVAPNQSSPAPATLNVAVCGTAGSALGLRRWWHQPLPTTSCAGEWAGESHPQTPWGSPTRARVRGSPCPGQVLQPAC